MERKIIELMNTLSKKINDMEEHKQTGTIEEFNQLIGRHENLKLVLSQLETILFTEKEKRIISHINCETQFEICMEYTSEDIEKYYDCEEDYTRDIENWEHNVVCSKSDLERIKGYVNDIKIEKLEPIKRDVDN